jgi:signal transduction histidine kinase
MSEDASGNVWFAFSNNLVEWDGTAYHRYSFSDGQIGLSVTTLGFRKDRVWMGGLGAVVLFRNGQFRRLNWKNSESPGPINGIVETEDGDLWTNGFTGIFHVGSAEMAQWLRDPSYRVAAERLDAQDGLAGLVAERWPEPSVVESADGRLWFATSKGVAWLDRQVYARNRNLRPPPVKITAVIGDGNERSPWSVLGFAPHTKNLEIDYTALSLAVPERVRFRYRLEGAETDWHDAGTRRQAFYNDLSAGPYHFRVTACNNDGVWSQTGASVDLTMAPAFYETAWFRWSAAFATASLLWAIGTFRVGALRRQLELRFAERLNERERIARELHDTLLQSLLGLILQFQFAADNIPKEHPARKPLERALDRADAVMREGRGRVKDLRGSQGATGIADQLTATADQFESLSSAKFQLSVQGRSRVLRAAIQEEALMIAREALVNAFTHSNASVISLEICFLNSGLRISVVDDGCGIAEQVLQTGGRQEHWGLPGMFERARKIHAVLTVNRRVQGGTRVQLQVSSRLAYESGGFSYIRSLLRLLGGGPAPESGRGPSRTQ